MAADTKQIESGKKKIPYPKSILFIISNEFCERFSYYGMRTILVLYFKFILLYSENKATLIYHIFVFACYFSPLVGAIVADSYLGKYWTILSISCVYAIGNIVLSVSSISGIEWPSLLGLALIAFGTGGIKPCVAAFGGDQFHPEQKNQLQRFFSLFYIAINSGSLISTFVTPIFRQDVHCLGRQDCYPLAFGVPAALMIISLVLFVLGNFITTYVVQPPTKNNVVMKVVSCASHALRRKFTINEKRSHWIEYADDKFDRKTINDVRAVLRILFLYLPLPLFWALFDQQASRWTLQALRMNGKILPNFTIKPDQIQAINPLMVILFIPVFDYLIYPLMSKIGLNKPLKRMVIGGLLASLSFGICGYLQIQIETENTATLLPGENQLAIINNGQLNVNYTGKIIMPGQMELFEKIQRKMLVKTFSDLNFKLNDGQSLIIYSDSNGKLYPIVIDENILDKSTTSVAKVYSIIDVKHYQNGTKFFLPKLNQNLNVHISSENSPETIGHLDSFEMEIIGNNGFDLIAGNQTLTLNSLEQGASYLQLIDGDFTIKDVKLKMQKKIVQEHKLTILWQMLPYFIITSAEIMFSVTGLEFSYSQAPASMKSVIQAAWLLTVAVGNLLVAIIADLKVLERQSQEFFFFGGFMFFDIILFALMAYFYVPFNSSADEDPVKCVNGKDQITMNDKQLSSAASMPMSTLEMHVMESDTKNDSS